MEKKLGLAIPKLKVKSDPELTAIDNRRISIHQRYAKLVILKQSDGSKRQKTGEQSVLRAGPI